MTLSVQWTERVDLRQLCALSPVNMTTLALKAGVAKSALSNFLAGRRALPAHAKPRLFNELGLTSLGVLRQDHCFAFDVNEGTRDIAEIWLDRIFPNGGKSIRLSDEYVQSGALLVPSGKEQTRGGWALSSESALAIVRESHDMDRALSLPGNWDLLGLNNTASMLFDCAVPQEAAVKDVFHGFNVDFPATWTDVRALGESLQISPDEVIRVMKGLAS